MEQLLKVFSVCPYFHLATARNAERYTPEIAASGDGGLTARQTAVKGWH
jgi:hypothetical protein